MNVSFIWFKTIFAKCKIFTFSTVKSDFSRFYWHEASITAPPNIL